MQVFHEFLHKFLFSTPQCFHLSTKKNIFHFSIFFPLIPCGEKTTVFSRNSAKLSFPQSLLLLLFFSFVLFLFLRNRRKNVLFFHKAFFMWKETRKSFQSKSEIKNRTAFFLLHKIKTIIEGERIEIFM